MLKHQPLFINPDLAHDLDTIRAGEIENEEALAKLAELLQAALQLEFATIPVYLSAAFSLGNENESIRNVIVRVAIEEMLHFTVVANLLTAIGESPDVAGSIPSYPKNITIVDPPLHLELRSYSDNLVRDLFMRIETPEEPIPFTAEGEVPPKTVGLFYDQIIEIIEGDLIPELLDQAETTQGKQITGIAPRFREVAYLNNEDSERYSLPDDIDFFIKDKASAVRHLKWIVDQGEGTSKNDTDPIAESGLPAHYYRFTSILKRKWLVADQNAEKKYSYSGGDLNFDPNDVHQFDDNVVSADFEAHEYLFEEMVAFEALYHRMNNHLENAFNSAPPANAEAYDAAMQSMRSMWGVVSSIIAEAKDSGVKAGVPMHKAAVNIRA